MPYVEQYVDKLADYKQYRPSYPAELYYYLSSITKKHDVAWDVGTGNGQAAVKLSEYYATVIASDINQGQIDLAMQGENIKYYCWPAEKTLIKANTVDLIVVAQSLHWFDLDAFYREAHRAAVYNGVIAAWCYSVAVIDEELDALTQVLYSEILGDRYWPNERQHLDTKYKNIKFPFARIKAPQFKIKKEMNFTEYMGYLNTWTAVKQYVRINQENPINLIYGDLKIAWGDPATSRIITWPIHMLIGHVS